MYRVNRPVGVFLNEAEIPCQGLRDRSWYGQQQDRSGHLEPRSPAKSERALNKFLTEYYWDENQLNGERLKLLQQTNETR